MKKMKSALQAVVFTAFIFLLIVGQVLGTGISGAVFKTDAAPGQHIAHEIDIINSKDDNPTNFSAEVLGFGQGLDGSFLPLTADQDKSPYSARSFLRISPASFLLEPNQTQKIAVEGDIPSDVTDGGRYALIFIKSKPANVKSVGVALAFDAPVLITVNGAKITKIGELTSLELNNPISAMQQNVSVTFKNTGNYYYKVNIVASLKDKAGNILANTTAPIGDSLLPLNSKQLKLKLMPGSPLKADTYSINASASLDDGTILATKEVSFEVKP